MENRTRVETQGSEVLLNCSEAQGEGNYSASSMGAQWMRVAPAGTLQPWDGERVVVEAPGDQGKFVCYSGLTVHRIVYVSIKGNYCV